jgi:PAS domain S-box-containing protein
MAAAAMLTLVPMGLFAAYQIHQEAEAQRENIEQIATTIAKVNAAEISRIVRITEQFLERMAANPDIRALDPARCGTWFQHFSNLYPQHSNLLTKDLDGHPVCSALPIAPGTRVAPANYLDGVRQANGFSIGIPNQGPVSKRWVVPLDYPLRDAQGKITGTISAPIDLVSFNPFVGQGAFEGLPDGTTAALLTADMTMLARSKEPEKWIGSRRLQVPELIELIRRGSGSARFVSSIDQVERIHAGAKVPGTNWITIANIPTAAMDAAVNRLVVRWGALGLAALLLSVAVAFRLSRSTAAPISDIVRAARRIAGGETHIRADAQGAREVVELAAAFNSMLDEMDSRRGALMAQAERFSLLLKTASDGIHVLDMEGRLILASDSFYRMLGFDPANPPMLRLSDWNNRVAPDEIGPTIARLWKSPKAFTTRHQRRDGSILDVEVMTQGLELDGRPLLFASARDITQRLRDAQDLARSNAELEQFAYVASHDLRQPLRMVTSYLGLIEKRLGDAIDEDMKQFLWFAIDGAKRMDRLIQDLLEYSRAGRDQGALEPLALADILREALIILDAVIVESGAQIRLPDSLPQVMGNRSELTRLFQNLLGNAVKYRSPDRPPVIELTCRPDGDDWLIGVKDNGIGIAPKDQERAFAIFQRLVSAKQYEGTGIGLAVCRKVVEHHGGRIWLESELDQGCTFLLTLPRLPADPGADR